MLKAFSEIFLEFSHQALRPVVHRFESSHEEAEHGRFVHKFQSAYQFAVVVEPVHAVFHVFDLREGEYAPRYSQSAVQSGAT